MAQNKSIRQRQVQMERNTIISEPDKEALSGET
jgi:hypothetical protein